jgi:hypothetical protein
VRDRRRQESQAARAAKRQPPEYRIIQTWSDPSPTVGIPLTGNVRVVDVKPPAAERVNDEPIANLLVESFDLDEKGNAIQSGLKRELRRGAVANMVEDAEYVGDGPWIDTRENFNFVTGMTVLDVRGGKKLAKDYTSPGRVLVMGPAGELLIRNELDDKLAVQYHDLLFMKSKGPPGAERGAEGFGPGFGPVRGGGRGRGGGERN